MRDYKKKLGEALPLAGGAADKLTGKKRPAPAKGSAKSKSKSVEKK